MKDLNKSLYRKAIGYKVTEKSTEYEIDDKGVKRPVKEKEQTKYIPPDVGALKTYLEMTGKKGKGEFDDMTDEELEKERKRLLKELNGQS
jgi:hypothetical protein